MTLQDAAADYATAAHKLDVAKADRDTLLRRGPNNMAMGRPVDEAHARVDRAMRAMCIARDRLCEAAVDSGQGVLL